MRYFIVVAERIIGQNVGGRTCSASTPIALINIVGNSCKHKTADSFLNRLFLSKDRRRPDCSVAESRQWRDHTFTQYNQRCIQTTHFFT
jgi:hypothetical protein